MTAPHQRRARTDAVRRHLQAVTAAAVVLVLVVGITAGAIVGRPPSRGQLGSDHLASSIASATEAGTVAPALAPAVVPHGAVAASSPMPTPQTHLPTPSGTLPGVASLATVRPVDALVALPASITPPYVWGATGPNAFDCSGLVQWSFAQAGIRMPRVAAEQFLTGVHETLAQAQPGDLLFWTYDSGNPTYVDHTAIYLGEGKMVVAPHSGADVEVVAVPTAGAVRVTTGGATPTPA